MARRQVLAAACAFLAGCSTLGNLLVPGPAAGQRLDGRQSFRDSLGIAPGVVAATSASEPAQGFCVTSWHLSEGSADLYAVTPQEAKESVACHGLPVFLLRPVCMVTTREAWLYPLSTPFVAIRCPYGASVWVTGYVKP
jgi:hypothetical protein